MRDTHYISEEYMSVSDAAVRLGVDVSTVRRWVEEGQFPGTIRTKPSMRGRYRIPVKSIEAFENNRRVN